MANDVATKKKKKTPKKVLTRRARILVAPRREIPDPEGEAIRAALERGGFGQVREVRAGRCFEITLETADADSAAEDLRQICDQLLVHPTTEEHRVEILDPDDGEGGS